MSESAGSQHSTQVRSELATAVYDAVIAAAMSFPFPRLEVRLLGNSAEHELKPAVELLTMPRKQLRAELTLFSVVMSQIEVTASEIGLAGWSGYACGHDRFGLGFTTLTSGTRNFRACFKPRSCCATSMDSRRFTILQ